MTPRTLNRSTTILLGTVLASCTSVQWIDRRGAVHVVGLGHAREVAAHGGRITRVVAPGLALRLVPSGSRYGAGWMETTLYQTDPVDGARELLAIGDRGYGVLLDPGGLVIGAEERLVILEPTDGRPVVQEIFYSSGAPSETWLQRKGKE
jgi:hypothetical protein